MGPKRDKTMLLVACAVTARTAFTACSDNSGCMGFYASDATSDVTSEPPETSGCIGFYPCDAYATECGVPVADADADANDAGDSE
jgi:hypothetical protein